ncbi:MAG TPA: hypothetical protein ENI62_00220 [Gammaproteobacteria bacterium]|nr:hypothetical protein [Gammaproteobacteria bacterium]
MAKSKQNDETPGSDADTGQEPHEAIDDTSSPTTTSEQAVESTEVRGAAAPPAAAPPETAQAGDRKVGSASKNIALFALFFSLMAVAAAVILWYRVDVESRLQVGEVRTGLSAMQGRVDDFRSSQRDLLATQKTLQQEVQAIPGKLDDLQRQLSKTDQRLAGNLDTLKNSLQRLYSELNRSVDTWAKEEVEQLLVVANQRLQLAGDSHMALAAIQLADQRLQKIGDPAFTEVRTLLASEVTALKNLPIIDRTGMALKIASLANSVPKWPLKSMPKARKPVVDSSADTNLANWRNQLQSIWQDLKTLVRIQNLEQPKKALLAPDQRYFLVQNLQITLRAAGLALLQSDQKLFRLQLGTAAQWLQDYFAKSPGRKAALAALAGLQKAEIRPAMPDISASLLALRRLRKTQNRQ